MLIPMPIIDEKTKSDLKGIFSKEMHGEVKIWLFTSKNKTICEYCDAVIELVDGLSATDDRIKVFKYDIEEHEKEAKIMGVENVPAILLHGAKAHNIYYYGIPTGYEFSSLIQDMIDVSNGTSRLSSSTKNALKEINEKVDIKVFVTPTCPYCPQAVRMAHQMALENSKITASMIEATEFMELSSKYGVMGVPKIVINDKISFEGALPEQSFLEYVKDAASK